MSRSTFVLRPRPPFRLELTVWTLRRRADNVIDRWDGTTYRRALVLPGGPVEFEVVQEGPPEEARLRVAVHGAPLDSGMKQAATATLERMLGLHIDLAGYYESASRDAKLRPLAERFRGMKPPRFPSVFEGLVNSIACQQITLTLGIRLLNRVAESYGPIVAGREGPVRAFPRPEDLAHLEPESFRELGFSRQKGRAVVELARIGAEGQAELEGLVDAPVEEAVARLCRLRGVGRWSAEYVLLRALGRTDIFPGDDVGARKNLQRWLHLADPLDYATVGRTLMNWRPYGGLIYFHLLLDRLAEAGYLQSAGPGPTIGRVDHAGP